MDASSAGGGGPHTTYPIKASAARLGKCDAREIFIARLSFPG
jgi:hypothetical protein